MTNLGNYFHQAGLSEHIFFLALLIPTFLVLAAAAISFMDSEEPSAAVSAMTMAVCGPCEQESR